MFVAKFILTIVLRAILLLLFKHCVKLQFHKKCLPLFYKDRVTLGVVGKPLALQNDGLIPSLFSLPD